MGSPSVDSRPAKLEVSAILTDQPIHVVKLGDPKNAWQQEPWGSVATIKTMVGFTTTMIIRITMIGS